jgi:hypothetical protein
MDSNRLLHRSCNLAGYHLLRPELQSVRIGAQLLLLDRENLRARVTAADYVRFQVVRVREFKDIIIMQVKSLTTRSGGMAVPLKPGRYDRRIGSGKKSGIRDSTDRYRRLMGWKLPMGSPPNCSDGRPHLLEELYRIQVGSEFESRHADHFLEKPAVNTAGFFYSIASVC